MFNNEPLLSSLDRPCPAPGPSPRERARLSPCLPDRLPNTGFLEREAQDLLPKAALKQLRYSPQQSPSPESEEVSSNNSGSSPPQSPSLLSEHGENQEPVSPTAIERKTSFSSIWSTISAAANLHQKSMSHKAGGPWRDPEPFEVFGAVEKHNIMYLMEIRDRAFHLLLRKSGDMTPLLHAMRIGHQDVAVVLLGAFSRYINNLQDEDMLKSSTKVLLKALRTNLKLAIDFGLQSAQSDLIASFLQTLVMSEGEKWVWDQVNSVAGSLRAGTEGKPVENASTAVRKFATAQLGKAKTIAALEDYVANATADLLLMGAWTCVLNTVEGEQIPSFYFARDDRVYKAFVDRIDKHRRAIERTCTKRLKWQVRVLKTVLEGRAVSYRSKVETLTEEFDLGPGV